MDASLVDKSAANTRAALSRTEEKLVEMSNGCICCTLREDLLLEVRKLIAEGRFNCLLIESTGIGEPLPGLLRAKGQEPGRQKASERKLAPAME